MIILKKIIGISILFVVVIAAAFFTRSDHFFQVKQNQLVASKMSNLTSKEGELGKVVIINIDEKTNLPIKNSEYTIINMETDEVVSQLVTDLSGKVETELLPNGRYKIVQDKVMKPYKLNKKEHVFEISSDINNVTIKNKPVSYVKSYVRTDDGKINITEVLIPVAPLLQLPELPNGCEITSLTAVLNYYGYNVSKTVMADDFLRKEPFVKKGDKLYGANPYKAYAGNPRSLDEGFFTYTPPILEAANNYFKAVGGDDYTLDISGSSREEIMQRISRGVPVLIWVTLDLGKPKIKYSWHFHDTGEKFDSPTNLHAVVLNGYDGKNVHVMNPLIGQTKYNADAFFKSYKELGSHAMVIVKKEQVKSIEELSYKGTDS